MPAFLLSEIALAFQIGFLIFLPFSWIIDLVVAAILMSMGMMMVPPDDRLVAVSNWPFFVVADGWSLLSEALVRGYI